MRIVGRSTVSPAARDAPSRGHVPRVHGAADGSLLASVQHRFDQGQRRPDDRTAPLDRWRGHVERSGGAVRQRPSNGGRGSLKFAPITRLEGDASSMVVLWIDREAFPGQPLFNPETEGCLPMSILVADSINAGETWTPWRLVPMPDDVGPPSLTNGILRLPKRPPAAERRDEQALPRRRHGSSGSSISGRMTTGRPGPQPVTVVSDPTGRLANWDQRGAVTADGRLVSFAWIYDFEAVAYREDPAPDQRR